MGVTDLKNANNAADKNWRSYCDAEDQARVSWKGKWGWILSQYKKLNNDLAQLRKQRPGYKRTECTVDRRIVRPFPDTVAKEIGWLSGKPEFQLEVIGPYPNTRQWKPPILPPDQSKEDKNEIQ